MNAQTIARRSWVSAIAATAVLAIPALGQAQQSPTLDSQVDPSSTPTVFYACYVPGTGTVYRIKEPDTPTECGKSGQKSHIEFSWTDGADVAGIPGPEGPQGPQGEKGDKGDPGEGGVSVHGQLSGLDADDHAQYLLTTGVRASQGFAVTGQFNQGSVPASGAGNRMMWYPGRAAFRAGGVPADQWDEHNIGLNSVALGWGAVASGAHSFALYEGQATGQGSIAAGFGSESQALGSVALGPNAKALGIQSFAASAGTARGLGATALFGGQAFADNTFAWRGRASNDGAMAMGLNARAEGVNSTAIGTGAEAEGAYSTAIGENSKTAGTGATAVGYSTMASGNWSMAIGMNTIASGVNSMALGRMASTNGRTGAMVLGDASTADLIMAELPNEFAARFAGGFRLRTSADLLTGCNLPAGSGQWNCQSSRFTKENFAAVDGEDVLRKLSALPIQTYAYITEPGVRHLGPMSQDFHAAFGLGADDTSIAVLDASGVAMAGVQALEARSRAQSARIDALEVLVAELLMELGRR
jgi:trimeric autotransporter adhesin